MELQCALTGLVERHGVREVVEALGICCELRACLMHEQQRETHRVRAVGLQLMLLAEAMTL